MTVALPKAMKIKGDKIQVEIASHLMMLWPLMSAILWTYGAVSSKFYYISYYQGKQHPMANLFTRDLLMGSFYAPFILLFIFILLSRQWIWLDRDELGCNSLFSKFSLRWEDVNLVSTYRNGLGKLSYQFYSEEGTQLLNIKTVVGNNDLHLLLLAFLPNSTQWKSTESKHYKHNWRFLALGVLAISLASGIVIDRAFPMAHFFTTEYGGMFVSCLALQTLVLLYWASRMPQLNQIYEPATTQLLSSSSALSIIRAIFWTKERQCGSFTLPARSAGKKSTLDVASRLSIVMIGFLSVYVGWNACGQFVANQVFPYKIDLAILWVFIIVEPVFFFILWPRHRVLQHLWCPRTSKLRSLQTESQSTERPLLMPNGSSSPDYSSVLPPHITQQRYRRTVSSFSCLEVPSRKPLT